MRLRILLLFIAALAIVRVSAAADESPLLVHSPTLSKTQVVFVCGGYLWSVPREGGEARQLTTGGHETTPIFSPDGKWIAFTGQYDGNIDAYVMPVEGGSPRRLTWHPGADVVRGWTPDSKRVLFDSAREAYADFDRLYTVPVEGGWPEVLPMWRGEAASYSPDAKRIAYVPNLKWQTAWKRYKGGQTTPIYIVELDNLKLEKVPRQNSNDDKPVWFGDTVYFLSDRNGSVSIFAYDTKSKAVKQVVENKGLDFKSLSAGPDALIYEQFGEIFVFDPNGGKSTQVSVHVSGDSPATRPHYEHVGDKIQAAAISPTGARAVFEARGEILSVPAEKGDVRNLTRTTGIVERDPSWSPDGKSIAFFSDESGEYALHIVDQSGAGTVKKINLGNPPSYFYGPVWSPDSKKIAYTDKRLNFWYVDVEKGIPVKVDSDRFEDPSVQLAVAWSPDSKWLTYSKFLESHLRAIFVYSLDTAKVSQVTASIGDARYSVFDKSGKYLYFAASTDVGLSAGWLDLSSYQHPVLRNVYAIVLKAGDKSPVEPESDEEKGADAKGDDKKDGDKKDGDKKDGDKKNADKSKDADNGKSSDKKSDDKKDDKKKDDKKKDEPAKTTIDLDGIEQRTVSLPIKPANYVDLAAGKEGVFFLSEIPDVPRFERGPQALTVSKFDLKTRKTEAFLGGAISFAVSNNGEKVLYRQGPGWFIAATAAAPKPGEGALKISEMEVYVDPRVEWNQMYRETWRIERDFLYDPGHHGLNLTAAEKKYAPYLKNLGGRADLNYLFDEMLGEITIGHMFIRGGDEPPAPHVKGGLLGADYKIENGRYRFARIFNGENWNPDLRAPLTQPGVEVKVGEYLLEVNGVDVRPPADVNKYFENTADEQVRIKVGPNADGKDAHEVTVVPVGDEEELRTRAWEEDNRRKVDELSGGKLAYVHVPDTNIGGYLNFNRFYFGQVGKQAAIIDERYNHGGEIADSIIDLLERPMRNCAITRDGEKFCSPLAQIYGPKTMIINEMSGSGGDALPWMFKQDKVGQLVGTRTWGGLVGIWNYPVLMDGGRVTAPRGAIYGLHGEWEVENTGISPNIEVENDPESVAKGHDPQLEKAVQVTLDALKKNPVVIPDHPPYPNYHKN